MSVIDSDGHACSEYLLSVSRSLYFLYSSATLPLSLECDIVLQFCKTYHLAIFLFQRISTNYLLTNNTSYSHNTS